MKAALLVLPLLLGLSGGRGSAYGCDDDDAPSSAPAARERTAQRPAKRRASVAVRAIAAADLCVTSGGMARSERGRMRVDGPKMRTVAPSSSGDVGELRFQYRGATEKVAPLASGQIRRQVGLKLRAADGCNLVYAMWRIEPKPGIEVQVKRNQGSRVHSECGTRGYRKISPRRKVPVPTLEPGSEHTLRAEITGQELSVWADGVVVWEGDLGPEVLALSGPVGMRSDNVALDIELLADPPKQAAGLAKVPGRCASAADGD
jgi:hypothetical protein